MTKQELLDHVERWYACYDTEWGVEETGGAVALAEIKALLADEPPAEHRTRSPVGQLFAELAKEEDETLFCGNCGHSFGQHSKGPAQSLHCRHCPCPQWQPQPENRGAGT